MSNFNLDYEIVPQRPRERLTEAELRRLYRQARENRAKAQMRLLVGLGHWFITIGRWVFRYDRIKLWSGSQEVRSQEASH